MYTDDLWDEIKPLFKDVSQYKRLIGKLIYLDYAIELVSQFIHKPRGIHWKATLKILTHIKGSPGKSMSYKKHESTLKVFQILIMQVMKQIESPYLTIALVLEAICLFEGVRSKVLYLILMLK